MNAPRAALVLTTIGDGRILEDYAANFRAFGHLERVRAYVIADRKTPASLWQRCDELRRGGWDVVCPRLEEQEAWLSRTRFSASLLPWNSDHRRNLGYLMAAESGAELILSIDDDNYCRAEEDFFAAHAVVCQDRVEAEQIEAAGGWWNICEELRLEPAVTVYPRGFPYFARHRPGEAQTQACSATVRINAGLWLAEPDLDAMTWLVAPVRAREFSGRSRVLGARTWSPINTQNTGLAREVLPSYYFVRMGYPLAGIPIDRYGDIFSGYFSQACAKHLGHAVRVGTPVANHLRNSHNYLKDATNELACIWVLEDLLAWLPEARLEGSTYGEAYLSLAAALDERVQRCQGFIWSDATRGYFHAMTYQMRQWVAACRQFGCL